MRASGSGLILLAFGIGVCAQSYAQTAAKLECEVATIKPVDPNKPSGPGTQTGGPGTGDPGFISYHNDLRRLFMLAYGVRSDQIAGPDWIRTGMFDIRAKVPPGSTVEQVNGMLQTLLVERFGVKLHHEMRDAPAYTMTVAKGGLKLKETAYPNASPDAPARMPLTLDKNDFPILPKDLDVQVRVTWIKNGSFRSTFRAYTVARLAEEVEAALPDSMSPEPGMDGAPPRVFDRTGLTGMYDFTLEYEGRGNDTSGPSLPSALEKQLGLKLDKIVSPQDVIVIDHIEKTPAAN